MTREAANAKILKRLEAFLITHPSIRFGQALWAVGIVKANSMTGAVIDNFYEESEKTLANMVD